MKARPHYTARCERFGRWWTASFPEVPGVFTQARRLDQVEDEARDALAIFLDVAPDTVDVNLDVVLPEKWAPLVDAVRDRRADIERCQKEARRALERALEMLVDEAGLSTRDAGRLVGLSHQRVAALHPNKRKGFSK